MKPNLNAGSTALQKVEQVRERDQRQFVARGRDKQSRKNSHSILQVPTTQLAKISIDPKFAELTADVLEVFL